jgi:hypothetical protein
MYFVGLIIVALATGHYYNEFTGWMVLGTGLILAAIWNGVCEVIAAKSKNTSN